MERVDPDPDAGLLLCALADVGVWSEVAGFGSVPVGRGAAADGASVFLRPDWALSSRLGRA